MSATASAVWVVVVAGCTLGRCFSGVAAAVGRVRGEMHTFGPPFSTNVLELNGCRLPDLKTDLSIFQLKTKTTDKRENREPTNNDVENGNRITTGNENV